MKKSLSRRITAYFLIIMVLTIVFSAAWNYFSTRRSIIEMEKRQAEGCSTAVRSVLDHYGDSLEEDWGSPGYLFIWNAIGNYRKAFGHDAIFLYTYDVEADSLRILLVSLEEETAPETAFAFEIPNTRTNVPETALYAGDEKLRRIERGTGLRRAATWVALLSEPGSSNPVFVAMDYSLGAENSRIVRDFLADILIPSIALGVAFLVMMLVVRRRVAAPIRVISERMKRFAANSRELPEPAVIRNEDEIGEIASSFETMTREITAYIGSIEELTKERVATDVQLDIARRIQHGLVPEKTVTEGDAFRVCAMTRPAKAVGGDFYDCFTRKDGTVCFLMGDVSGKGITGALFMAVIKTMLREKLTLGLSPAQALNEANDSVVAQNPEGLFATVFAAVLDSRTGEMTYANAGHTWPVVLDAAARVMKPETGIALGLFEDAGIVDETMRLLPGQGILLYTDGVTDALNARREHFGMDRLLETLRDGPRGREAADEVLLRLIGTLEDYSEGVEPFDDLAALVLFLGEPDGADEPVELPVAMSSFDVIKQAVLARTGGAPSAKKILLACDEALANIVEYSGAARLTFRCAPHGDGLRVVLEDDGTPFDPVKEEPLERPFEELDKGGMGLSLIRQVAAAVRYERADGMNRFTMDFTV